MLIWWMLMLFPSVLESLNSGILQYEYKNGRCNNIQPDGIEVRALELSLGVEIPNIIQGRVSVCGCRSACLWLALQWGAFPLPYIFTQSRSWCGSRVGKVGHGYGSVSLPLTKISWSCWLWYWSDTACIRMQLSLVGVVLGHLKTLSDFHI